MSYRKYASVILDQAVGRTLDYGIPDDTAETAVVGSRVMVPLRSRSSYGYILEVKETSTFASVKAIERVCSDGALITGELLQLALWVATYYCAPLHKVLKALLPAPVRKEKQQHKEQLFVRRCATRKQLQSYCVDHRGRHPSQVAILDIMLKVQKGLLLTELLEKSGCSRSPVTALVKKGLLSIDTIRINRSPLEGSTFLPTQPKILNSEQSSALAAIHASLDKECYQCHLLHGITGSGKTEVYLQAIEYALKQGKNVLILVPEIALTEQTTERFRSRFQEPIALLHHRLSSGERFDSWHNIQKGQQRIVIGARSAVFAPLPRLGLIIVDEEHEASYKQNEEAPCYHARDVAVMRASMNRAVVILGSATPSLESYHNAIIGKYTLNTLNHRADSQARLPDVTVVNMKSEYEKAGGYTTFSEPLIAGIAKRIAAKEQTILFLNRRGYHTSLICTTCGSALRCAHCDVALTFHKGSNQLACHMCGHIVTPPPSRCPSCQGGAPLRFRGVGTEQIEAALNALFPDIRTLRLDADTTRHKGSHQQLLRAFATGKADVMIGTQMVAKGLDFPAVTLVAVLNSDAALNIPDFRASETVFQLITQVAGRAGRGERSGEVIIQTMMPDNSTIKRAATQDYIEFYNEEIAVRELFGYPPYSKMAKVVVSSRDEKRGQHHALKLQAAMVEALPATFEVYPVEKAGHGRIQNRYRYQFLIRGPTAQTMAATYHKVNLAIKKSGDHTAHIDINPLTTFF